LIEFYQIDILTFSRINGAPHNFNLELPDYLSKVSYNFKQYSKVLGRKVTKNVRKKFFIELMKQLNVCKMHWCSHMVRHRKRPEIKQAYNKLFQSLFQSLSAMQDNKEKLCRIERDFLDAVVYTGILYREIGFPYGYEHHPNYILDLEYDDSYCSWNANDEVYKIHHMRDGNRYNIHITATANEDFFGFSIMGFNSFFNKKFGTKHSSTQNEYEVVFKLRQENVLSVEKIPLSYQNSNAQ
jgi:hypothetical protein